MGFYILLYRPEAINQLGFIAEKILSRKHKEFMSQINEVTQSLQDSASSNYRDENLSFGGGRKEPVKATETAVDLLQSFSISTPSTVKRPVSKSSKPTKPVHNQDISVVLSTKEDVSVDVKVDMNKEELLRDMEHDSDDDRRQDEESRLVKHRHKVIQSSSEESDGDNDIELLPVATVDDDRPTDDNSFTTLLHDKLYPGPSEEPEVKWSTRTPTTNKVSFMEQHKQYSCCIHPVAPWHRCRPLCRNNNKISEASSTGAMDKQEITQSDNKVVSPEECTVKQTGRVRKRRLKEVEHLSSDSETESLKIVTTDNLAANEQIIVNPSRTRTSKRVRRAPIKLRQ